MKDIQLDLNIGDVYNGFEVLDIKDVSDYDAKGIWLRHKASDLEVFHMVCDDNENLFAFAFGTPSENSTGVAHIIEHSVLCGSENFPLKDPFIRLVNQSIKTFLNALTFSDKTVYPAASVSEQDYFNLMAVYGDAVFFPKLEEWTFLQEGHRLELDDKNNPSIQGIVYNEMKGNYSSFDNIALDWVTKTMLKDSIYDHDSGGDPLEIPTLTYEEYKKFHQVHYSPSNCKVFLYGDISTKKQLDFLDSKFLSRFKEFPFKNNANGIKNKLATMKIPESHFQKEPLFVEKPGPVEKTQGKGSIVTISWLLEESIDSISKIEAILLAEILMGHDGAPLSRALIESELGEDLAPLCGLSGEGKWAMLNTGLRGVAREDSKKVYKVVKDVLQNLYDNGIPQKAIDSAILSVEFSQREIHRYFGPYSLSLMRKSLQGWIYGFSPFHTLTYIPAFKTVKERVKADPDYIRNILKKCLLDNNRCGIITVYPDEAFENERIEKEKDLAKGLLAQTSIEEVRQKQQELIKIQQTDDTPENVKKLPFISPEDLEIPVQNDYTNLTVIKNGIPFFINEESTNGISYLKLFFPIDILEPEDYIYLSVFSEVITNIGFGGQDWVETSSRVALNTGVFFAYAYSSSMCGGVEAIKDSVVQGRDWMIYYCKFLLDNTSEVMKIFSDCLLTADFSDKKRIKDLILEYKNRLISSITDNGSDFVSSRTNCRLSITNAKQEILNGFTQLFFIIEQIDNIDNLIQRFIKIQKRLLESGIFFHLISDSEGIKHIKPQLDSLVEETGLFAPVPPKPFSEDALYNLTDIPIGTNNLEVAKQLQVFCMSSQVAFSALSCRSSDYTTKESVSEGILAHLLTNNSLWEQIRTVGGAYGAWASVSSLDKVFTFSSYRDPKPYRSLEVYIQVLETIAKEGVDKELVDKAITGCYSKEIQPKTPSSKASSALCRYLYGISPELKKKKIEFLLSTTPQDISNAAKRILEQIKTNSYKSVLCGKNMDKSEENTGNIISLPV